MANIISNQAYEAIQVPTEVTPEVQVPFCMLINLVA